MPVCKQGEVLVNGKCVVKQKEQPKEEKPTPKTSLETKNNQKIEVGKPFKTTKPDTIENTPITVDEGTSLTLAYLQKYSEDGLSCGVYECPPQLDVEFGASIGKLVAAGIGVFIPTLNTPPVLSLILFLDEGRTFFSDLPKYLTGLEKETLVAIFAPDMIIVPGGTEFTVEVNKDGTKVTVFKDFVYVITEHSDKPLLVKANEFAFADKKEAYTKTEKIDSADKWWEKLSQQKERPNVPTWIKNNANWWSQGQLDDNEFLKGIEYMVEKDIILLPKEAKSVQSSDEQSFTPIKSKYLSTDSREYILPQTRGITKDVLLKGHVDGYYRGEMVYLIIELPDKNTQQQEVLASNGDYSTRIALDRDSQVGEYKIKTVYKNSEVDSISFLVKKEQDKQQEQISPSNISKDLPKWIKNTAKWWSEGTISEDEFVNAIRFLVGQRIIQIE